MAVETAVDQVLALKKRARRRLVGSVALVLLMLIILPNVLKDHALEVQRAPITLTMQETTETSQISSTATKDPVVDQITVTKPSSESSNSQSVTTENTATGSAQAPTPAPVDVSPRNDPVPNKITPITPKIEKTNVPPQNVTNSTDVKATHFLIQVGVFSDTENVKKLQAKISEAGFSSRTVKLATPKGEKIRLRVGSFVTRDAAAEALKKLEAHGLSGMVLIDE